MITKEAFDGVYNDFFTVAVCLITRLMSHERHDCTLGMRVEYITSRFIHNNLYSGFFLIFCITIYLCEV